MAHQKILIINGHPTTGSLNHSLSIAYRDGAIESGTEVRLPGWYYRLMYARPSINALRKSTLQFCGIIPVKVSTLYVTKEASKLEVEKKIRLIYQAGLDRK